MVARSEYAVSHVTTFSAWTIEHTIPSELDAGHHVLDELLARLEAEDWTSRDMFGIRLALEEAVVNAIKHGNRLDKTKQVHVMCKSTADKIWIKVTDQGPGFDPEAVPDCTDPEHIDVPNGRGIMLMRNFMSRVEYNARGQCGGDGEAAQRDQLAAARRPQTALERARPIPLQATACFSPLLAFPGHRMRPGARACAWRFCLRGDAGGVPGRRGAGRRVSLRGLRQLGRRLRAQRSGRDYYPDRQAAEGREGRGLSSRSGRMAGDSPAAAKL